MSRGAVVVLMLCGITMLSQFHRAAIATIGPELMRELGLSPAMLGLAGGIFFVPLLLAMIPVGLAFDRYGPRRVIVALTAVAVLGSAAHALIQDGATLIALRIVVGIGCGASFMGAVLLTSRWYAGERFTTVLSWVFAASNLGTILAATPFAALSGAIGWRWAFMVAAGVTALAGIGVWFGVRDAPPGHAAARPALESLGSVLRGLVEVWRSPGLARVIAMHVFAYASMLTVLATWAAPYLNDVHGLDPVARGNVIAAMGIAQVIGLLCYGPLDRLLNSRKRVVIGGGLATITVLATLALWPQPPLAVAAGLLVLHCFVTSYAIVIVAHGRSLFPERLAGRGVTTVNLGQTGGAALLPIVTGWIVVAFPLLPGGLVPEIAYRAAFGAIAAGVAFGLIVYAGAADSRPRP